MFRQLNLLGLLAVAAGNPLTTSLLDPLTPSGQIVGGIEATIEDFPYQVAIRVAGSFVCGGSIISADWVTTAAQCTGFEGTLTVLAGTATLSSGGTVHNVTEIIVHENYATNIYGIPENDVALLRVSPPFSLDATRQPIRLFKQNEESVPGVAAVVSGWGATAEGGGTVDVLRAVTTSIVSKSSCNDVYISVGGLPPGQICAAVPEGGKGACRGDTGGPLAIENRFAGIVSWGYTCSEASYPGVYSSVAALSDYIANKTGIEV